MLTTATAWRQNTNGVTRSGAYEYGMPAQRLAHERARAGVAANAGVWPGTVSAHGAGTAPGAESVRKAGDGDRRCYDGVGVASVRAGAGTRCTASHAGPASRVGVTVRTRRCGRTASRRCRVMSVDHRQCGGPPGCDGDGGVVRRRGPNKRWRCIAAFTLKQRCETGARRNATLLAYATGDRRRCVAACRNIRTAIYAACVYDNTLRDKLRCAYVALLRS